MASGGGSGDGGAGGGEDGAAAAAAEAAAAALQRLELAADDHPLSTSSSSRWKAYFQVRCGAVRLPTRLLHV